MTFHPSVRTDPSYYPESRYPINHALGFPQRDGATDFDFESDRLFDEHSRSLTPYHSHGDYPPSIFPTQYTTTCIPVGVLPIPNNNWSLLREV